MSSSTEIERRVLNAMPPLHEELGKFQTGSLSLRYFMIFIF